MEHSLIPRSAGSSKPEVSATQREAFSKQAWTAVSSFAPASVAEAEIHATKSITSGMTQAYHTTQAQECESRAEDEAILNFEAMLDYSLI